MIFVLFKNLTGAICCLVFYFRCEMYKYSAINSQKFESKNNKIQGLHLHSANISTSSWRTENIWARAMLSFLVGGCDSDGRGRTQAQRRGEERKREREEIAHQSPSVFSWTVVPCLTDRRRCKTTERKEGAETDREGQPWLLLQQQLIHRGEILNVLFDRTVKRWSYSNLNLKN